MALFGAASLAAGIVYAPTLGGFFVSDDFVLVERGLSGPFAAWGTAEGGFLRPLIGLLFWIDAALWGLDPLGYRLTNLLLHAGTALAVGALARRFVPAEAADEAGLSAALLFLCHPSHAEAVAWISGRTDLASTLLQVVGLVVALDFLREGGLRRAIAALLAFAGALAAKESALPWPGIFAIVVLLPRLADRKRTIDRTLLVRSAGLLAASVAVLFGYFFVRRAVLGVWLGGYGTDRHLDFDPWVAGSSFARFVVRSFLPGTPITAAWAVPFLGVVVVGALGLVTWRRRTLAVPLLTLAASFALSLATAVTFLDVDLASPRGERFLYLPSVFVCVAIVATIVDLVPASRRRRIASAFAVLLAVALLVPTLGDWRHAAQTSRALVDASMDLDAARFDRDAVVRVVHLPSELRGRFVFHNGYDAALRLFLDQPPSAALPLAFYSIDGAGRGIETEIETTGRFVQIRLHFGPGVSHVRVPAPEAWRSEIPERGGLRLEGEVPPAITLVTVEEEGARVVLPAASGS